MSYTYSQSDDSNKKYQLTSNQENIYITSSAGASLYMITHLIISFFAIYLSWKCNKTFDLPSFTAAFFCPYLYIIFALATKGGCGIFDAASLIEPLKV